MAQPNIFDPNLPPEIDAENRRILQQQAIAEAMLKRGMTPTAGPVVSWTQGLGRILNAYSGRQAMDEAEQARTALGQKYQSGLADEVSRIAAIRQGKTILPDAQEVEQANDQGTAEPRPTTTGDPRGAIQAALVSQYAPVRQMGTLEHKTYENEQTKAADREARSYDRLMALEAAAQNQTLAREERVARAAEAAQLRRELAEMQDKSRRELAEQADATRRLIAGQRVSVNVPPPVTVTDIQKPDGSVVRIDARTGRELGASPKESDAQKRENKRQFNMQGIGATIQQAEDLLGGVVRREDGSVDPTKKGATPTGSGIGNVADKALGIFGVSTAGGDTAAKMKSVGGALVAKMPRMEGPQSDKDVALYKEMAGMIGDANVPRSQRLAALDEVKRLWAKYERLNPDAFAPAGSAAGGSGWSVVK